MFCFNNTGFKLISSDAKASTTAALSMLALLAEDSQSTLVPSASTVVQPCHVDPQESSRKPFDLPTSAITTNKSTGRPMGKKLHQSEETYATQRLKKSEGFGRLHPPMQTKVLSHWFQQHLFNPYPSRDESLLLSYQTKLSATQITYWFANARRRHKILFNHFSNAALQILQNWLQDNLHFPFPDDNCISVLIDQLHALADRVDDRDQTSARIRAWMRSARSLFKYEISEAMAGAEKPSHEPPPLPLPSVDMPVVASRCLPYQAIKRLKTETTQRSASTPVAMSVVNAGPGRIIPLRKEDMMICPDIPLPPPIPRNPIYITNIDIPPASRSVSLSPLEGAARLGGSRNGRPSAFRLFPSSASSPSAEISAVVCQSSATGKSETKAYGVTELQAMQQESSHKEEDETQTPGVNVITESPTTLGSRHTHKMLGKRSFSVAALLGLD